MFSRSQQDFQKYLKALFNDSEAVCAAADAKGTMVLPLSELLESTAEVPSFVSVNPLDGSCDRMPVEAWHSSTTPRRADVNVTEHRNFLIEFDGAPLQQQYSLLIEKRVPFTTLVYSGGKSLHAIIALTEPISRSDYDELFTLIRYVLWQCDPSCRNPSRLTRAAGATRIDPHGDPVEQELIGLSDRISKDHLLEWLARFSKHIARCQEREAREQQRFTPVTDGGGVKEQTLQFLEGTITPKSSRHKRLVAAAFELKEAGLDYDEVLSLIEMGASNHGLTADPKRARDPEKIVAYVFRRA